VILGLSYLRLETTLTFLGHFPRPDSGRYPIVLRLGQVVEALIRPLQDRDTRDGVAGLNWWEIDTYVGVFGIALSAASLRGWNRRGFLLVGGAVLCMVLAWNNGHRGFPSYYLHTIRPWDHMVVITRWSLYAAYLLLVAAVDGLVAIHRRRPRLAVTLALAISFDLGFHVCYGYRDTFTDHRPAAYGNFDQPPLTVHDEDSETWENVRANRVSMGAQCSVLGYGHHYPARQHVGDAGYGGDFPGAKAIEWSPNHIVFEATPGATLLLNMNPSSYWLLDGAPLFPGLREFDIAAPFTLVVPPSGRVDLRAAPPGVGRALAIQSLFAVTAAGLWLVLAALERRRRGAPTR
jgi:hypothetical protein